MSVNLMRISELEDYITSRIQLHSLEIVQAGDVIYENYYLPYQKNDLHRMFSISKSVVALAIGTLIDDGKVSLNDPVIKYFDDKLSDYEKLSERGKEWIARTTIRDVLMMRSCHSKNTYKFDPAVKDYTKTYFSVEPDKVPGRMFHYDTAGYHVLAALVEKLTGTTVWKYLCERFSVMELSEDGYYVTDPVGVSMGGSGLTARTSDLVKFGKLMLGMGEYDGVRLISSEYMQFVSTIVSSTEMSLGRMGEKYGYGAGFWGLNRAGYAAYGMGGQFIFVYPEEELIIVTTADTQGFDGGNQVIYDAIDRFIFEDECKAAILKDTYDYPVELAEKYFDKTYVNKKASSVSGDASKPTFESISFHKDYLSYMYGGKSYEIKYSTEGYAYGIFPVYEKKYASHARALFDNTFAIEISIIDDAVGNIKIHCAFDDEGVTVFMKKVEETMFSEFSTCISFEC